MVSKRKIYASELTFDVPSEEKDKAEKTLMSFNILIKKLRTCDEHLDLIYIPFKNNPNITANQAYKARAALRRYRDRVVDNFNIFKIVAFRCFIRLQEFSSDTQILKFSKAFVLSISDIEKQVNRFIELFSTLEAKSFSQDVVSAITNIKKEIGELDQIIEDRIKPFIENNILAISWTDKVSDELQEKVERKVPMSVRLVEERKTKQE